MILLDSRQSPVKKGQYQLAFLSQELYRSGQLTDSNLLRRLGLRRLEFTVMRQLRDLILLHLRT